MVIQNSSLRTDFYGTFKVQSKCFVYGWIRNNKYIYIGMTTDGIICFNNHKIIRSIFLLPGDEFEFWYCDIYTGQLGKNDLRIKTAKTRNLYKRLARLHKPTANMLQDMRKKFV